ncbi:MAG: hypothetical protein IJI45_05235 [Anaerolineaceae bacterium]|nr:hypothetical protein [Anaerolineaceae bacterium]
MADIHNWYGLAIRRFGRGQTVLVPIAWDSDEKPSFEECSSEYESVSYAWFESKKKMKEAIIEAREAGYYVQGFPEESQKGVIRNGS